jgi:integrase
LSNVPRHLPWEDVQKLIASVDTSKPTGLRDKAVLLVIAVLGLRNQEVRSLQVSDIFWRTAEIRLRKTKARLKNKAALRDSLKQLLEKATDIKDIMAIEAELNRVQADVDSMEGRIKALKAMADLAAMELLFTRTPPPPQPAPRRIYGPLGYFFKGLCWGIEKLFIIRK